MPAVVVAALMSWAGWSWWSPLTTEWWLAELPAAVLTVGLLLRDRPLAMAAYFARLAAADRAPRVPPPPAREDLAEREDVYVRAEQADFLPPVADLDAYRERAGRRAA